MSVSQLSRLARQELLSSLRKGCLGIWGFISCLLLKLLIVLMFSAAISKLPCTVTLPTFQDKKRNHSFAESFLNRFPEKNEELVAAHTLQEKIMIDAFTGQK